MTGGAGSASAVQQQPAAPPTAGPPLASCTGGLSALLASVCGRLLGSGGVPAASALSSSPVAAPALSELVKEAVVDSFVEVRCLAGSRCDCRRAPFVACAIAYVG